MTIRNSLVAVSLAALCLFVPANAQTAPEEPAPVEQPEPAPEPEAPATVEPVSAPEGPDTSYTRELRSVEEDVNNLKERVFRSKATLALLKELVVEGATSGSKVVLWHVNDLGRAYALESIQYFMDGRNVFSKVDQDGEFSQVKDLKVHEQPVPPGSHNLQVKMILRGSGLGVFSYLKTYQFKVQSSYAFEVADARVKMIRVIADTRGGARKFQDRPVVRYEERADALPKE